MLDDMSTAVLNPVTPGREPMTVVDFPDQLRNDIFYCQRALKEHIKIHQFCAVQNAIKPTKRYGLIIKCIEDEIRGIANDQQKVIATMKQHLKGLQQKMLVNGDGRAATPHSTSEEFDNKIIRSYLDMHRPSIGGLALQASGFVQARASEKELIRNYDLLSDLQLFMRPTSVIERLPLSPMKPGGRPSSQSLVKESRRNFMATLKAVKPQPMRTDLDSEEEDGIQFLSEGSLLFGAHDTASVAEVKPEQAKRSRGRPRKPKLGLLGNGSGPSTRANSPELVTMPWVDLPSEPVETNDYDQTGFMQRLGLYTLDVAKFLKNKRPERRRRTVQSTEKTDFHYGQLDIVSWHKDRVSVLGKNKKAPQQYLSPKTFKKRRTFDRSASSSPPNDGCTCSNRNVGGRSPCTKCGRKST